MKTHTQKKENNKTQLQSTENYSIRTILKFKQQNNQAGKYLQCDNTFWHFWGIHEIFFFLRFLRSDFDDLYDLRTCLDFKSVKYVRTNEKIYLRLFFRS